jgi:hypothetical protein
MTTDATLTRVARYVVRLRVDQNVAARARTPLTHSPNLMSCPDLCGVFCWKSSAVDPMTATGRAIGRALPICTSPVCVRSYAVAREPSSRPARSCLIDSTYLTYLCGRRSAPSEA